MISIIDLTNLISSSRHIYSVVWLVPIFLETTTMGAGSAKLITPEEIQVLGRTMSLLWQFLQPDVCLIVVPRLSSPQTLTTLAISLCLLLSNHPSLSPTISLYPFYLDPAEYQLLCHRYSQLLTLRSHILPADLPQGTIPIDSFITNVLMQFSPNFPTRLAEWMARVVDRKKCKWITIYLLIFISNCLYIWMPSYACIVFLCY